jgi:hypothetical protein
MTQKQQALLNQFADASDTLLKLKIISTDSFTGEIGEYVACKQFGLTKSKRVNKAVDGICERGKRYKVKAKVTNTENYSYNITKIDTTLFDYLAIVYFDMEYQPIKILKQLLN